MLGINNIQVWFSGKDIMIDVFSALVVFFIMLHVIDYSRLDKDKKRYRLLFYSFLLLTLSFISRILTHFIIYYNATETRHVGMITLVYQAARASDILIDAGLFLYMVFSVLAFYFLYLLYAGKQTKSSIIFTIYLLLLIGYLSHFEYYIFHLTSLILLLMISSSIFRSYSRARFPKTRLLAYSFVVITLSQAMYMLIASSDLFYVAGEIVQLVGYTMLLLTFVKVLRDGKKKSKT